MAEEKKASEIIVEMQNMLTETRDTVRNLDHNFKLLLAKLNRQNLAKKPRSLQPENSVLPKKPTVEADFQKSKEQIKEESKVKDSPSKEELIKFTPVPAIPEKQIEILDDNIKKTPIQQRVVYSEDGKNIYMAKIEILTLNDNKLIKQTRTNQTGKWLAALPAGEYKVNIFKAASSNKPKIESTYTIKVPDSVEAVELDPQKI